MKKINRFLSVTLVLTLLISSFSFVKFSDYTAKAASGSLPKINFSTVQSSIWHSNGFFGLGANKTNLYKNTTSKYLYGSSTQSAKFTSSGTSNLDTVHISFSTHGVGTDWSYGDTIVAPIYNAKPGNDAINFVFFTSSSSSGYYYKQIKLDWSGWKLVKIKKSSFGKKGGDEKWANINGMYINSNGWGTNAVAESIEIYIDSVYLTSNEYNGENYIDFNDPVITDAMGLTYANASGSDAFCSAKITASGSAVTTKALPFDDYCVLSDWTGGKVLALNVYNKNANGQVINVVLNKTADTQTSAGYTVASFTLNHTGWKKIEIPLFAVQMGGDNPGLNNLKGIYFNIGGFGSTRVQSNVEFYVANISLQASGNFVSEAIGNSAIVYANSTKAYNELSAITLDNAPVYVGNKLYAPLSLFEKAFGAQADSDILTMDSMTLEFTDGSPKVKIGEYTHILSENAFTLNSEIYVLLSDICEIFDIPVRVDGRLAIMGSESDIDFIGDFDSYGVNEVSEQISKKLDKTSSGELTVADCNVVIENKLKSIVGTPDLNDVSDSAVASKLASVVSTANSARNLLNKTEGATELFTDQTSTETTHMTLTINRIRDLAIAYGTYGCELYGDETLLSDILYGLEWFYQNRYGEDEINGTGWHRTSGYNWHDWQIGTPYALMYAMMIVRDSLTDEQITNYLKCFHYVSPDVYSSGGNYMDACELLICAAALEKDPESIMKYKEKAEEALIYVQNGRQKESQLDSARQEYTPNKGHGFYTDGSYLFHTLHAMNGTYGLKHLTSAAGIVKLFEDTKFEISKPCKDIMADWIVDAFDSAVYGTRMFRMFLGRGENPSETSTAKTVVTVAVKCFSAFDDEDRERVGSIIKAYGKTNPSSYASSVELEYIDTFNDIVNSDGYNSYRYDMANVFGNVDKVVQRRSGWGMGISMSSSRIFNYESINGLNKNGWYLGDGRTELILKDEANSSAANYWRNINYYRLPGTTVDTQERQLATVAQGNEYLSSKDFVGGVELEGKYATAAMHLESYHNDSDYGKDGGQYGGVNPAHTNDLTAKKSYFMFDNEIYCLGAEVNASDNNNAEVLTVIENKPATVIGSSRLTPKAANTNRESNDLAFRKYGVGNNWSNVATIRIPVYSAVNNGQIVNVIFSKAETDIMSGYYFTTFTVNWSGWKVLELKTSSFSKMRGIKNWSDINSMYFNIGGWDSKTYGDTDLCFADIEGVDSSGNVIHTIPFTRSDVASEVNLSFTTDIVYDKVTSGATFNTNLGALSVPIAGRNLDGVTWANVDGKVGYLFPEGYSNGVLKANATSNGYLEMWFSHGINPQNGTYAYALLPNMTKEQTMAYAENPDVEILANTGDVQAVRYNKQNITSIVFWNAGEFNGISVSDPMLVMVKDSGKDVTLSVSDPTHKLENASVTINRALLMAESNARISQTVADAVTTLDIDFSETLGSSIGAKLKANDTLVTSVVFRNADGSKIVKYISPLQTAVAIDVEVANLKGEDYKGNIYVAVYSSANKLESVQVLPVEMNAYGGTDRASFSVNPTSDTSRIEVYAWDKDGIKPCGKLYRN